MAQKQTNPPPPRPPPAPPSPWTAAFRVYIVSVCVVSHATLRRHALAVGARLDQRVTEPDEYDWPESRRDPAPTGTRLIVAIDGTYLRSNLGTGLYQHYVVAGRIDRDGILAGRFAWIARWPGEASNS
jgi:hypothetical protein